jgi:hypothetical protein
MRILQALRPRSPGRRATAVLGALALAAAFGTGVAGADTTAYSDYSDYPQTAGYDGSYSYVRTLEGSATLIQGDTGDRDALQLNQPVLVGDRVLVSPRGRVELVLSDRNLLRIDAGSEVAFEALAASPDRQDRLSVLGLSHGNLQLVVVRDFLGEGLPRVDTRNVTVYPRDAGSYRITADGSDWSGVVARDGSAEVVTREGSLLIRRGEEAVVEGDQRPRQRVRQASREDSLELWGRRLDQEARYAAAPYVDEGLQYEAAALDRHGSWVSYEGRYAWRPRVAVEWRPYHHGRWAFSPLGLTWVSYEPWGWVPYHYGTWDHVPSYGWVWYPGRRFAPAWVYWYWTDAYVAWVPYGHLGFRYYDIHGGLHRYGVYGWAGGHWSNYNHWTFCDTRFLGHRDQHRFARDADRFARDTRLAAPRKGLITTDTRGLTRTAVERRAGIVEALAARRTDAGRELPDVTSFVAGRRDLPDDVRSRILVERTRDGARSAERVMPSLDAGEGRGRSAATLRPDIARDVERSTPSASDRIPAATRTPDRAAPVVSTRPAERPAAVRPTDRSTESWRQSADRGRSVQRAPEATRPSADAPRRIEPRPSTPPPSRSVQPAPSSGRAAPESWRSRPPVRLQERPSAGASDRSSPSERYSVPRRVIDGVRSNTPGSTPFRTVDPSDRSERVQPRPERVEPRRSDRVEPRSAPPPRVEPRSQRTSEPRRVQPAPRSAPPPRASSSRSSSSRSRSSGVSSRSSSPSRSSSSATRSSSSRSSSSRATSSRSSNRSSSGRSSGGRREPPTL